MAKNIKRVGIPSLLESLLANILTKSRKDPTIKMPSTVKFMGKYLNFLIKKAS
ncbi:hypothetical protein Aasi_1688 [Candidatus Amoebophilus asiaticus 5a2]|uniref:Uncharacterized protein n=1 Tax=Amoebophilus asiaticus (strain 5a2) TaxID=452471 RepID=C3L3U1_AMOA5|nr:hypothetical protein Aasi_1688 [Candidatus Amoebophilus asiaticus 5a2]